MFICFLLNVKYKDFRCFKQCVHVKHMENRLAFCSVTLCFAYLHTVSNKSLPGCYDQHNEEDGKI